MLITRNSRVIKLENRGKLEPEISARLEATKSFRLIHAVTLNTRAYAVIGILNDQLIKREEKKKMCEP